MNLIDEIKSRQSVAFVGLAKNTGKTECLNYVLRHLKDANHCIGVTSIGVDGERVDSVTSTPKPEIELYRDTFLITSETHYRCKRLPAEIYNVSVDSTSLGRLITARVVDQGKILLSGPASTQRLSLAINELQSLGAKTVLIDGALSRLSLASPSIAEALVLSTGAAVSNSIAGVVRHTRFIYELTRLPQYADNSLIEVASGLWGIDETGQKRDLGISSAFLLSAEKKEELETYPTLYAAGSITDRLLNTLSQYSKKKSVTLVIRDFTRMFATRENYLNFVRCGGKVQVLQSPNLIAICINPVSPQGFNLNSDELCYELSEHVDVPVYDILKQTA